jgi:hypothetical protein
MPLDPPTLAALLELLLDESPAVVAAVREKLAALGPEGEAALREAARGDDARLRVRARTALLDLRRRAVDGKLAELGARADSDLDLEEGAFLLAEVEYPHTDRAPYLAILDSLGDDLRTRVELAGDPRGQAAALCRLLAHEWRLRANDESFHDPDNSFLPRVLDRRRGIPISLATVYLLVARRADLPLVGVGAPGHFLLRFGPPELDLTIDPVTGRIMSGDDAMRWLALRGFPVTKASFSPATARETLVRTCSNLGRPQEPRGRRRPSSHPARNSSGGRSGSSRRSRGRRRRRRSGTPRALPFLRFPIPGRPSRPRQRAARGRGRGVVGSRPGYRPRD